MRLNRFILTCTLCLFLTACLPAGTEIPIEMTVPSDISLSPTLTNAATVNGTPIPMASFEAELLRFEMAEALTGVSYPDAPTRVINLLIEEELIRQKALAQGIVIDPGLIDNEIASITAEMGDDYFTGWLSENHYTIEDFRSLVTLNLMTEQLTAPIITSVPTTSPHVRARHILVNSEATAQEILDRLANGEDFALLAAEYSLDVTTKQTGGDLGFFPRGSLLVPEVEDIAFSLNPGELSGIVQTEWGYHIVQTMEKVDNQEIRPEVRQRMIAAALETWRQGLSEGAVIEVFIETS